MDEANTILIDELLKEYGPLMFIREANAVLSMLTGQRYTSHPRMEGDVASPIYNAIGRGLIRATCARWFIQIDTESFREYLRSFRARKETV